MENDLWLRDRFSRGQAWVDMILMANHDDRKILFDNQWIIIQRGSFITSIRKLSDRWQWDKKTTVTFLDVLEHDGMIKRESDRRRTLLIIVNYDKYQKMDKVPTLSSGMDIGLQIDEGDTDSDTDSDTESPTLSPLIPPKQEDKNDNNDNNEKEIINVSKDTSSDKSAGQGGYKWLIDAWNELVPYGVTPLRGINEGTSRIKLIRARERQYGRDEILEAIANVKKSSFLQGKIKPIKFFNFDWFIRPDNFPKVLEGQYNDGKYTSGDRILDDIH